MSNKIFNAFVKEAAFTNEIICSGITEIRKANYATKGIYFHAFTSLSTGFERLCKLCVILDYYIDNNGQFPNRGSIRSKYGHNLNQLMETIDSIADRKNIKFNFLNKLTDILHKEILTILTNFAMGDRYSNIDALLGANMHNDSIAEWFNKIDLKIFKTKVSNVVKDRIFKNAAGIRDLDNATGNLFKVSYTIENGKEVNNVYLASFLTGINKAVVKYRQLYLLHIFRYLLEVLESLEYSARHINVENIPYFSEIFVGLYNYDEFFLKRKKYI